MIHKFLSLVFCFLAASSAFAQSVQPVDKSASNLMAVLRESTGASKQDASLVPMGKLKAKLADGREVEFEPSWYSYIGDMHVRFVFDTPTSMLNASADDLQRLALTPEAALELAIANIRRVYGAPTVSPWNDLMQVSSNSPDLDSSYFLDHAFWSELLKQYPEGIVAMVVKRGGLLYAPLSNDKAVDEMRKSVAALYESSERLRISSALYLFKDGRWSVFQSPAAQ